MVSNKKNVANAFGGKTARACDSCIRKRARWYCAADDAFLCQACDSSVHSANSLARRHERVRLKTASLKALDLDSKDDCAPSWHRGFTRKARTPRNGAKPGGGSRSKAEISEIIRNPIRLVPEVGSDELSHEEHEEEHLLRRVPILDPSVAELCNSTTISNEAEATTRTTAANDSNNGTESSKSILPAGYRQEVEGLHGPPPSDMDLAEFAADVESLLGRGLENESFGMEELGLKDCNSNSLGSGKVVKLEKEEELTLAVAAAGIKEETVRDCCSVDAEIDTAKEPPFVLSCDYDSHEICGEEEEEKAVTDLKSKSAENEDDDGDGDGGAKKKKKRKILLSLNYEEVISAWVGQGSPWTTGKRPDVDYDDCWPDCMVRVSILFFSNDYLLDLLKKIQQFSMAIENLPW